MEFTNKFDDDPRTLNKADEKTDKPELYAEKDLGVKYKFY